MEQLGGLVQVAAPGDLRLSIQDRPGVGESLKDTATVTEGYVDCVGIRLSGPFADKNGVLRPGLGDAVARGYAEYVNIPVINLARDMQHPTQAVAYIMVLKEKWVASKARNSLPIGHTPPSSGTTPQLRPTRS